MSNVTSIVHSYIAEDIHSFIKKQEATNTGKRYLSSIKLFAEVVWKKDMDYITVSDIENVTYKDMEMFQFILRQQYKESTVNNTVSSVTSLFQNLGRQGYDINPTNLKVKPLKVTNTDDAGLVEWFEVDEWIEYLKTKDKDRKKDEKIAFLHLARITGIRMSGLLNLNYKDLRKQGNVWVIHHSIKGKSHRTAIKEDDAEMLLNLKQGKSNFEKIFNISQKTVERMFKDIREQFNIQPERNVTPHSLRVTSAIEVYESTGNDLKSTMKHLGHSNSDTTMKYIDKKYEVESQPSLMIGVDLDKELEGVSCEEIKEVLPKLSRSAKYELLNALK